MQGRKAQPTAIKEVRGNPGKRELPKDEPRLPVILPTPPNSLSTTGKVAFNRYAKLLYEMGVLTVADVPAVEEMAELYAEIQEYRAKISTEGSSYETRNREGETVIKGNPAVGHLRSAAAQLKSYYVEFGMTASARTRVSGTPPEPGDKPADPMAEFFH